MVSVIIKDKGDEEEAEKEAEEDDKDKDKKNENGVDGDPNGKMQLPPGFDDNRLKMLSIALEMKQEVDKEKKKKRNMEWAIR